MAELKASGQEQMQVDELYFQHNVMIAMLEEVSNLFDKVNFDTFDSIFPEIVKTMKEIHEFKAHMIKEYGIETLIVLEPEAFLRAKQIENKFDNLLRTFLLEKIRLERELKSFESQKKLMNYKRYEYANQRTF